MCEFCDGHGMAFINIYFGGLKEITINMARSHGNQIGINTFYLGLLWDLASQIGDCKKFLISLHVQSCDFLYKKSV